MGIQVIQAASRKDLLRFIKLPLRLYADDPLFVPHLISERKEFFSPKNPIFEFTEVCYLLALDERGAPVGRVTAHINRLHNEFHKESVGFFGFFESVDRLEVASALMEQAEQWLRTRGMRAIRGPFNFSTNEECGLLVEGFDTPPTIMMPHTKPYYPALLAQLGYAPVRDLIAYQYSYTGRIPEYLERFTQKAQARAGVTIRKIRLNAFEEDVRLAFSIYERAWADNWGFVPMTEKQFEFMARSMRPILDPDVVLIAEMGGEPVGFSLALPDYNPILRKMKGRLLPFGIFHFLLGRRSIHRLRVLTLGVVPEHRKRGIDVMLVYHTFANGLPKGYYWSELSWVLDTNVLLRRAMERMGAQHYKTYRIYEKPL